MWTFGSDFYILMAERYRLLDMGRLHRLVGLQNDYIIQNNYFQHPSVEGRKQIQNIFLFIHQLL